MIPRKFGIFPGFMFTFADFCGFLRNLLCKILLNFAKYRGVAEKILHSKVDPAKFYFIKTKHVSPAAYLCQFRKGQYVPAAERVVVQLEGMILRSTRMSHHGYGFIVNRIY